MNLVIFAYHDIGCMAIQTLHKMGHNIAAVFTHDDDPGENVWFGSVKKTALQLGLPVFTPEDVNDSEWIKKIKALQPDLIFSFYYRKMICDCILHIPKKGAFNLHGSLLPKYRGRAPVNWAILHGEKETGITLHHMVKKPDAGDIVAQKKTTITEHDTALTVFKKLVPLTNEILLETMPLLENNSARRIPQNQAEATYFGGRKPEDGKIDWTKTSDEIYNLIRAVTHPYPGAFTVWEGKKTIIWQAKKIDCPSNTTPGKMISQQPLIIACGKGALEIVRME